MRIFFVMAFLALLGAKNIWAQTPDASDQATNLPRMGAFRSNLINARSGPGPKYPIEWIYKQKNAPVEIVAEFELWRKIKDWDGAETWVHKSMLNNKRWAKVITPGTSNIYAKAQTDAKIIARVEDQTIGEIVKCPEDKVFCLIKFSSVEGWVNRKDVFGIFKNEVIN